MIDVVCTEGCVFVGNVGFTAAQTYFTNPPNTGAVFEILDINLGIDATISFFRSHAWQAKKLVQNTYFRSKQIP